MADLEFYTKRSCGLCDRLKTLIEDVCQSDQRDDLRIIEIDIAGDPGLTEQFRFRVPVVIVDGEVILEGRPEVEEVRSALDRIDD